MRYATWICPYTLYLSSCLKYEVVASYHDGERRDEGEDDVRGEVNLELVKR